MLKHGEPKPAPRSPRALQEPPCSEPPGHTGIPSPPQCCPAPGYAPQAAGASLPEGWCAKKLPEHQKTAIGEAKPTVFSTGGAGGEGQGVPDPACGRRLGRVLGRVLGQHRLTQSPCLFAGPGRSRARAGPRSQPLAQSFWLISLFFSMQKKKTKTQSQMTLQPIICWLLAGCSETVMEAPLASATPFHRPGKAGAAISCGTRRAGNVNYF